MVAPVSLLEALSSLLVLVVNREDLIPAADRPELLALLVYVRLCPHSYNIFYARIVFKKNSLLFVSDPIAPKEL